MFKGSPAFPINSKVGPMDRSNDVESRGVPSVVPCRPNGRILMVFEVGDKTVFPPLLLSRRRVPGPVGSARAEPVPMVPKDSDCTRKAVLQAKDVPGPTPVKRKDVLHDAMGVVFIFLCPGVAHSASIVVNPVFPPPPPKANHFSHKFSFGGFESKKLCVGQVKVLSGPRAGTTGAEEHKLKPGRKGATFWAKDWGKGVVAADHLVDTAIDLGGRVCIGTPNSSQDFESVGSGQSVWAESEGLFPEHRQSLVVGSISILFCGGGGPNFKVSEVLVVQEALKGKGVLCNKKAIVNHDAVVENKAPSHIEPKLFVIPTPHKRGKGDIEHMTENRWGFAWPLAATLVKVKGVRKNPPHTARISLPTIS